VREGGKGGEEKGRGGKRKGQSRRRGKGRKGRVASASPK